MLLISGNFHEQSQGRTWHIRDGLYCKANATLDADGFCGLADHGKQEMQTWSAINDLAASRDR